MRLYGQNFEKWCVFLDSYNAYTSFRIAKLTVMPHVGFYSYKLNLEVNYMIIVSTTLLVLLYQYTS